MEVPPRDGDILLLTLREGVDAVEDKDGETVAVADPEPDSLSLLLAEGVAENEGVALEEGETDALPLGLAAEEPDALPLALSFGEVVIEEEELQLAEEDTL